MDIIASMFAYLGCVTGIVGALVVSFYVYFATPGQTAARMQTASVAVTLDAGKTGALKTSPPNSAAASHLKPVITVAQRTENAPGTAPIAADARQKGQSSTAQLRRLAQEQRAKRWAYQQDPSFESRFMSYAD
jgi:acyl-CoA synthetase (AMP-forming)/AMP-acid ligase II